MIEETDLTTLRMMQQEVRPHRTDDLAEVAVRLLRLRDELRFKDNSWYHELTQNLATLDSASTFHPTNDIEKRQLDIAIQQALQQIICLISAKMK